METQIYLKKKIKVFLDVILYGQVPSVSQDHTTFIFKGKQSSQPE